ncbi:hypothetical protein [Clostridium thermobutyricum]|uniref:hypothetical protein n=1 Tax=Clostridium thermobutyricum TaxID=29372 RepID=UPI003F52764F
MKLLYLCSYYKTSELCRNRFKFTENDNIYQHIYIQLKKYVNIIRKKYEIDRRFDNGNRLIKSFYTKAKIYFKIGKKNV